MSGPAAVATVAQIIALMLALFLVVRGLRRRRIDGGRTVALAGLWIAIIVGLTLLITKLPT